MVLYVYYASIALYHVKMREVFVCGSQKCKGLFDVLLGLAV